MNIECYNIVLGWVFKKEKLGRLERARDQQKEILKELKSRKSLHQLGCFGLLRISA